MKIIGMLLSSLIIMVILSSVDLAFAAPAISIETSQSVYEYGDHLVMIINVPENCLFLTFFCSVTGDDAHIYITDPAERKVSSYNYQYPKNILNSRRDFLLPQMIGRLASIR